MAQKMFQEIKKYLEGIEFPVGKGGVVEHAREKGAPEEVLDMFVDLSDREYEDMATIEEAWEELGDKDAESKDDE